MEEKRQRATFISSKECCKEKGIKLHLLPVNFIRKKRAKD